MKNQHPAQARSKRGVALVITLSMLVLITVLVVGFTVNMRTEHQASSAMTGSARAGLVAQSALAHAVSLLQRNIPAPAAPNVQQSTPVNWAISPGQLSLQYPDDGGAHPGGYAPPIALSSGNSKSVNDPDLNQASILDGKNPIFTPQGTNTPMHVAWQNVLADPSQAADGAVKLPGGKLNQIVGRYAFWIDDECNKINLNTAYGKPATLATIDQTAYAYGSPKFQVPLPTTVDNSQDVSVGHPYSINLDIKDMLVNALPAVQRDLLVADTSTRTLADPSQVQNYLTGGTDAAAFYQRTKFFLTVNSRSPEFNAFGKARIFLADKLDRQSSTTNGVSNKDGVLGLGFVSEDSAKATRDLTEPLSFHSDALKVTSPTGSSLASDQAANAPAVAAVKQLTSYLNQTWPGYKSSFVQKWSLDGGDGKRQADQVAWNIYAMAASGTTFNGGYSVGSYANTTLASGQASPRSPSSFLWDGPLSNARILPAARTPMVTKLFVQTALTQKDETGQPVIDPATNTNLFKTNKYVVGFRVNAQVFLPKGYQGYQLYDSKTPGLRGWKHGAPDAFYGNVHLFVVGG